MSRRDSIQDVVTAGPGPASAPIAPPALQDVAVCGLGYVGLPLAREASAAGLRVTGYDISHQVVAGLSAGESHVDDVSARDLELMSRNGWLPTADARELGRVRTIVICVPTPLGSGDRPDLAAVRAATCTVARHVRPGTLVILESTTYPGTTRDVVRPLLEEGSGLTVGRDINLAYAPERLDPGNRVHSLGTIPKVVGGVTDACAARAAQFYQRFVPEVVLAKGTREAEMAKLLENAYRFVNIGLVNELARVCHELGIDVWNVIDCAATKPFGFQAFYPGPGIGGHCIPVDPHYLLHAARSVDVHMPVVEAAVRVDDDMPGYVAGRCVAALAARGQRPHGARVVLLGVAYKAGIADTRMSPAYPLARELLARGAEVGYHDPFVESFSVDGVAVPRDEDLGLAMAGADLVVLLQKHVQYTREALSGSVALFDARGLFASERRDFVDVM